MVWQTILPAAGSILGGVLGSSSARKAAEIQAQAAREAAQATMGAGRQAADITSALYRQGAQYQAPYVQAGQTALAALMSGLGLPPAAPATRTMMRPPSGDVQLGGAGGMPGMPGVQGAPVGQMGAPYGGQTFVNAQGQLVDAQGNLIPANAIPDFGPQYGISPEQAAAAASPFAGAFTEQFTGQDIYRDPGYEFRVKEAQRALAAKQAAGGNRFGGQALKDITELSQGMASQEFGSAYDRFMRNKQMLYERLSDLAGGGRAAGTTLGELGSRAGGDITGALTGATRGAQEYLTGGAAARAAGQVGSTGAIVKGIGSALEGYTTQSYLRDLLAGQQGGAAPTAPRIGGGPADYRLTTMPVRFGPGQP